MIGRDELPTTPEVAESARISAGQRRVNIIWERVQAVIALSVVGTSLAVATYVIINLPPDQRVGSPAFFFLGVASFLVMGFYFGRTNHQRIGGVGPEAVSEISGR